MAPDRRDEIPKHIVVFLIRLHHCRWSLHFPLWQVYAVSPASTGELR
jgi:hypothetical protein